MYVNSTGLYLIYSLFGCILSFYVIFFYKNRQLLKFSLTNNAAIVPVLPFVGTVYLGLLIGKDIPFSMVSVVDFLKKTFGFPCNLWIGLHYLLFSDDPLEIKIILNNPNSLARPIVCYDSYKILANNSLITLSVDEWRLRRKHLAKSYKPKLLKTQHSINYEQSCDLVKKLKSLKSETNLIDICNTYAFKNFILTSTGLEEQKVDKKQMMEFGPLCDQMQLSLFPKCVDPVTPMAVWTRLFPKGRKLTGMTKTVNMIMSNIIQQKKEQLHNCQRFAENTNEVPLLESMLIGNDIKISNEDIHEEMKSFSAAATETTGNGLTLCFACLGMNSQVQEKLYNEIMTVIGHNSLSYSNLSDLKYTEAVILETLRLFPSIPLIGRRLTADIDVGKRIIPKGVNYVISVFHLHRDPKYWKDPLVFNPDRFLPGNVEHIQPYTYLPFSSGPKDCIGKTHVISLMKTTIANVVRNCRISCELKSVEDIQLTSCLTMRPVNPIYCHFTPRDD